MKRIKLTLLIYRIIEEANLLTLDRRKQKTWASLAIAKFIGENYRRRQYKQHGYTCTNCQTSLNAGRLCKCRAK